MAVIVVDEYLVKCVIGLVYSGEVFNTEDDVCSGIPELFQERLSEVLVPYCTETNNCIQELGTAELSDNANEQARRAYTAAVLIHAANQLLLYRDMPANIG